MLSIFGTRYALLLGLLTSFVWYGEIMPNLDEGHEEMPIRWEDDSRKDLVDGASGGWTLPMVSRISIPLSVTNALTKNESYH